MTTSTIRSEIREARLSQISQYTTEECKAEVRQIEKQKARLMGRKMSDFDLEVIETLTEELAALYGRMDELSY